MNLSPIMTRLCPPASEHTTHAQRSWRSMNALCCR